MEASFRFYNVGQGCFYGGAIEHGGQKFVLVYDCGSVTKNKPLKDPIIDFRTKFNHIDLLVISHFDADHVNGIEGLIKGIRVERIVLPYMPLLQRLALVASYDGYDENYNNFISNPTTYFFSNDKFDVGTVSYVEQGSSRGNEEGQPPNDNPKFDRELEEGFDLGDLSLEELENDDVVKNKIIEDDSTLDDENVTYHSFNSSMKLRNELWEFVFYHRQTKNETDISDFQIAIDTYVIDQGGLDIRDLFTEDRRTKIKELYSLHIASDINYSSLCMYHGPIFKAVIHASICILPITRYRRLLFPWRWRRHHRWHHNKTGTMLTGDQFLATNEDFTPFYNYFRTRLDRTEIYQVPHHGSDNNWKMMPNNLNTHDIGCYVINHGYGRKKHPNQIVLQNLLTYARRDVVLNNEHTILKYRIKPIRT